MRRYRGETDMTRIPMLAIAMLTVAGAALAQSNPDPGAVPNTGISPAGPTYGTPSNKGGAAPSPGVGPTFGTTTGASPSVGSSTGAGPTFTTPPQPNSAPVPPNSNSGHPPAEIQGSPPAFR